ncbi:MAG: hypothetical protein JXA97_04605 [Anaerolineales bacterium]|nr:hypothetical protein [Anaerolineales bacterium]
MPPESQPRYVLLTIVLLSLALGACDSPAAAAYPTRTRAEALPADAVKRTPADDLYPPILYSDDFKQPVPLPGPVNTAGAEDSPFIAPDGTLYFFFTPDVRVPLEEQILDEVTGIYAASPLDGGWAEPERVWLQDPGLLSLDGCQYTDGNTMWFCTAREGLTGLHWFTAQWEEGRWADWEIADYDPAYDVGELHIYGDELYFHSAQPGGLGDVDLWVSRWVNGGWAAPVNLTVLNSPESDSLPFVTPDGAELWFTRWHMGTPAVFRSFRTEAGWSPPEMIVSQFAGEPTLDAAGNLYFVHHFYDNGVMLEADLYVAYRR